MEREVPLSPRLGRQLAVRKRRGAAASRAFCLRSWASRPVKGPAVRFASLGPGRAAVDCPLRFADGAVMVAAGRDLRQRATVPECQGRSLLAVTGSLPGGPQCEQSPCSAQKRRSSVTCDHPWSPQVPAGQHSVTEARYRRSTGDDAAAAYSAATLTGTSRSIVPHGPVPPEGPLSSVHPETLLSSGLGGRRP